MKRNSSHERTLKKFIIVLMLLCLAQSMFFGANVLAAETPATPSFAVVLESSRAKLNPGDEFDIIFNVRNIKNVEKGLIAMAGKFEYNKDVLELVSITGENDWNFDKNSFNDKNLKFVTDSGKYVTKNEVAFKVHMKVKETVNVEKPVETTFKALSLEASNAEYTILAEDAAVKLHIEKKAEENPEDPFKISSEKYEIKDADKVIIYVLPNTTVTNFNKNITVNRTTHVMDASGNEQVGDAIVKTGMKLTVDKENVEYTIVVLGDINRDGKMDILDLAKIKLHLIEKEVLTGIDLMAADVNKDGDVTLNDMALMKLVLIGLKDISKI